jgi:hypothetical protein
MGFVIMGVIGYVVKLSTFLTSMAIFTRWVRHSSQAAVGWDTQRGKANK